MNIYHYCSLDTFTAMITNETIRLSDITKSNDLMEIMWITQYIEPIFMEEYERDKAQYLKDCYSSDRFKKLTNHFIEDFFDEKHRIYSPYVCCFSGPESGDMLSQWRGYADDGRGLSVGIDSNLLSKIGNPDEDDNVSSKILYFDKIEYKKTQQTSKIRPIAQDTISGLKVIAKEYKKPNTANEQALMTRGMGVFNSAFLALFKHAIFSKSPFFKEENEYRISHYIDNRKENPCVEKLRLQQGVKFNEFSFQSRNGKLVSYFDMDFSECKSCFITEVIIGPKSQLSKDDVKRFLLKNNYPVNAIKIEKSQGSYI